MSDEPKINPARLRLTAGTCNFNASAVLRKAMEDGADRIEELETALAEALVLWSERDPNCMDDEECDLLRKVLGK